MGIFFSKPSSPPPSPPSVPTRRLVIAGIPVTVSEPENASGITFLLPGAMLSQSSYASTRSVLHQEQGQIVISFYINVLTAKKTHDDYAKDVPRILQVFVQDYSHGNKNKKLSSYNIVGHSVGGKIALLVATNPPVRVNRSSNDKLPRLHTVLALDPVDDRPPEFTNQDATQNRSLAATQLHAHTLRITFCDSTPTWAIPVSHNAAAILQHNPQKMDHHILVVHKNAAHMAYTDDNGRGTFMGWLMRGGTKQGNQAALDDAHTLIRRYI